MNKLNKLNVIERTEHIQYAFDTLAKVDKLNMSDTSDFDGQPAKKQCKAKFWQEICPLSDMVTTARES